ncbi:MAG: hypothetical protein ABIV48_08830 [Pyrinomonadaceae bacterium]
MFEQSLYEQEPVATPIQEGDLFNNYEIKTWEKSKRLYRILGISAIGNIFAILIIAQTSLLTMKGCDSPLVGRVCQVLDTVYVTSLVFGTDREYVDAVYEKTELGDSEITFVDVSGVTPPISYPEGYFQVANPLEYQAMLDQMNDPALSNNLAGIPYTSPSTGGSLIDTQPNLPQSNPNVIEGELPTFGGSSGIASNPTPPVSRRPRRNRVNVNPTPNDKTIAGIEDSIDDNAPVPTPTPAPTPLSSEAVVAVEINKKPLVDFADVVAAQWEAKEVDLNQDFTLVLNGTITKDGKLDREKSKFDVSKQKGDPKMIDVGKSAIEALGDSGYLNYLKLLGVDKINATLVQDQKQITVIISSAQKTPERASVVASGLNGYILIGKTVAQNPSDERTLLDGAKVSTDGKNFVLNFAIPKPIAQEMINRKLKESQAKKAQQPKPNGEISVKTSDKTAKK